MPSPSLRIFDVVLVMVAVVVIGILPQRREAMERLSQADRTDPFESCDICQTTPVVVRHYYLGRWRGLCGQCDLFFEARRNGDRQAHWW